MAEFVTVATMDDVPDGTMKLVQVADEDIVLANVAGTICALSDVCPHRQAALSEGELDGDLVTCPRHSSSFNVRTGEVVGPPAQTAVQTYEVRIEGGEIKVALPD